MSSMYAIKQSWCLVFLLVIGLMLGACGDSSTATPVPVTNTNGVTSKAGGEFQKYKSQDALEAFKGAGLDLTQVKVLKKEDYGSRAFFVVEATGFSIPAAGADRGGKIFSFATKTDLDITILQYKITVESMPEQFAWLLAVENLVVELYGKLDENLVKRYTAALGKLGQVASNSRDDAEKAAANLTVGAQKSATVRAGLPLTATAIAPTATTTTAPTATSSPTIVSSPTAVATATPEPATATPEPITVTPTVAPAATGFVSGGLGLDKASWEVLHGKADTGGLTYDNKKYFVLFSEGKTFNLSRQYGKNAVGRELMKAEAMTLMPKDASFVRAYNAPNGAVELYYSESLKKQIGSGGIWTGGKPGDFIVLYKVSEFILATGNAP